MDESTLYDIAIIGGGIAGSAIARDAALRGARVVLFEKNTFGSGTSGKSSKLIHGGLRYLEVAWLALKRGDLLECWKNFRFVFVSLRECRILKNIAPELVKPISFLIPIYRQSKRKRLSVYFGTLLYGSMSWILGSGRFPGILFSKDAVLRLEPELNPEGLLGGVILWDHVTDDQRLVEQTMLSAQKHGAQAFERAKVTGTRLDRENKIYEIDVESGTEKRAVLSRVLIDARGPWVDPALILPVAGSHITLKKFTEQSMILEAEDRRIFFVINYKEEARVGTTERICRDPDHVKSTDGEIHYLLSALKKYFPKMTFKREDILRSDAGVRPLAKPKHDLSPTHISREHEIATGADGVIHVLGVKLTDHRRAAEKIIRSLLPKIRASRPLVRGGSVTRQAPLGG